LPEVVAVAVKLHQQMFLPVAVEEEVIVLLLLEKTLVVEQVPKVHYQ
jgi:hypothetical protein